jgi:hypothetical protein
MSDKREILLMVILGILLGAWLSLNMLRGQPLFANPFSDPGGSEALAEALQDAYRETQKGMQPGSASGNGD